MLQVLEVHATDKGALANLPAWSKNAGHTLLKIDQGEKVIKFWIRNKY
ncbi:sulfurtransferase TusA family protein [Litchfieldia alkalitelluris]|nr:sulfurtransferase TusA family protein [Litchfieldia alkalitelluris]